MKVSIHALSGSTTDHVISTGAVATASASYFNVIPWSDIAGFLSVCWLSIQIGLFVVNLVRAHRGKAPISITKQKQ